MYEFNISTAALSGTAALPANTTRREPVVGVWYRGISAHGTGAIAQYRGWGEFTFGDGAVVDMTGYLYIEESPLRHGK